MNDLLDAIPQLLEGEPQTVVEDPADWQQLHEDMLVCRDLLTAQLAVLLAFAVAYFVLRWFHGR